MSLLGALLGLGIGLIAASLAVGVLSVVAASRGSMPEVERNGALALAAIGFVVGAVLIGAVLGA